MKLVTREEAGRLQHSSRQPTPEQWSSCLETIVAQAAVVEAAKMFLSEMAPLLDSDHRAELREAVRALEELEAK
jgi:hypothetical protein